MVTGSWDEAHVPRGDRPRRHGLANPDSTPVGKMAS